jgi:folate-binding protein YgfZ
MTQMINDRAPADFDRQYQALRSGAAVIELAGWSCVSVSGADRQAFLHNFCTNDVKALVPGSGCEAFFTNVKGKIIGHGVIDCRRDEMVIFGAPRQATRLMEHLDRYIIREDVKLSDQSALRSHLIINDMTSPADLPVVIPWNLLGNHAGKIVELPADQVAALSVQLGENGFIAVGQEAFTAARIEAGAPLFGVDFDETNLPQEVGRDRQAISFTKGCYLGQETVARIDALGHVNQRLVGVRFLRSEVPKAGAELSRHGALVGRMTSATFSPKLATPLGLAMVRREANSAGTRLESAMGDCEVIALPLG